MSADVSAAGFRRLRSAGCAIALATGLLTVAGAWIAVRSVIPADHAPVLTDNGYARGFTLSPLGSGTTPVRSGDVAVAIDGVPMDDVLAGRHPITAQLREGATWRYQVLRGEETVDVEVHLRRGGGFVSERLRYGAPILLIGLTIVLLGIWTALRRPDRPAARALLILGAGFSSYQVFQALSTDVAALPTAKWLFVVGIAGAVGSLGIWTTAVAQLALTFPEPVAVLRNHPWVAGIAYAVIVAGTAGAQGGYIASGWATLRGLNALYSAMEIALWALVLVALVGLVRTVWRSIRDPVARRQGALVALGVATTLIVVVSVNLVAGDVEWPAWLAAVAFLPIPAAVAVALVRGEFLDLRATVNRALVFGSLTAVLLAIYMLVVAGIGAVVGRSGLAASLPATGIVAVALAPLRARVQRLIDRIIYGQRGDPARVLAELGRRLDQALPPDQLLPVAAETVAVALRLPYVGIRINDGGTSRLACERGEPPEDPDTLPLFHQGRLVGELLVGPRRGQRALSRDDRTLLEDVARQIAAAANASRLLTELAASRSRLAIAREEERAQLRHNLHDRLGSHLVGLSLQLDTLGAQTAEAAAAERVRKAHGEAQNALEEVRRISRGLRPAELDELGLFDAINAAAARLSTGDDGAGWAVSVDAAVQLPHIPPAVASAAYHIATEALTNAYRHSGGSRAHVHLGVASSGSHLIIEVTDDGKGMDDDAPDGVGLRSMRARANDVGGRIEVNGRPDGGTLVRADLPLTNG